LLQTVRERTGFYGALFSTAKPRGVAASFRYLFEISRLKPASLALSGLLNVGH
jgi:hypothetical protein